MVYFQRKPRFKKIYLKILKKRFKKISIIYYIMPKNTIDYSKTIIYKIVCKDSNVKDIYIGSTTDFTRRKSTHKSDYKNSDRRIYRIMKEKGGWENWTMIEIEKFPCNDSNEAKRREHYYIENLKPTMNLNNTIGDYKYLNCLQSNRNDESSINLKKMVNKQIKKKKPIDTLKYNTDEVPFHYCEKIF